MRRRLYTIALPNYAKEVNLGLETDPNITDWIGAIGQALGALFTAAAVGVALWIAHRDTRRSRAEKYAQSEAQARLVVVDHPALVVQSTERPGPKPYMFRIAVLNLGDRPILGVTAEALIGGPSGALVTSDPLAVLDPRSRHDFTELHIENIIVDHVWTWRVYWEDSQGMGWEVTRITDTGENFHQSKQETLPREMRSFNLVLAQSDQ